MNKEQNPNLAPADEEQTPTHVRASASPRKARPHRSPAAPTPPTFRINRWVSRAGQHFRAHATRVRVIVLSITAVLVLGMILLLTTSDPLSYDLTDTGDAYYVSGTTNLNLRSVHIPASYRGKPVTGIGPAAFSDCRALVSVSLPDSIRQIGAGAFRRCVSLRDISVPVGVQSIGEDAFRSCRALRTILIPAGVQNIEGNIFAGCPSLTDIRTQPGGIFVASGDCLLRTTDGTLLCGGSGTHIPADGSVRRIGAHAIDLSVRTITLPDSVTEIEQQAFANCSDLCDVSFGTGLQHIGERAFFGCVSLRQIRLPDTAVSIGKEAFHGCVSLTAADCGGTRTIGESAFSECRALCELTLHEGLSEIAPKAFSECGALASLSLPDTLTHIGSAAFSGCTALHTVTGGTGLIDIGARAFRGCVSLSSFVFPDSLKTLGVGAFFNCEALPGADLPASMTFIGRSALYGCSSLTRLTLPFLGSAPDDAENAYFGYILGAPSPGQNTGYTPPAIRSVRLLGGTHLAPEAFSGCIYLTDIRLPDTLRSIGENAFLGCRALCTLTFDAPNGWVYLFPDLLTQEPSEIPMPVLNNPQQNVVRARDELYSYSWLRPQP